MAFLTNKVVCESQRRTSNPSRKVLQASASDVMMVNGLHTGGLKYSKVTLESGVL